MQMCLKWLGRLHLSVHTSEGLKKYGIRLVVYTNYCVKKKLILIFISPLSSTLNRYQTELQSF